MRDPLISVIVLTKDEEANLPHLLASLKGLDHELFVVDSGSTDRTVEIAKAAGADVLVLPSLNENWAVVVSEALGMGIPVVVTERVGSAELVREHGLGRVVDGSPEALASAINELLSDPELRRSIGARARQIVRERFSHDAVARRISEFYAAVIRQRERSASPGLRVLRAADCATWRIARSAVSTYAHNRREGRP